MNTDIDFLAQELTLVNDKVKELEAYNHNLRRDMSNIISQLIDGGFKEDSILIESIRGSIKRNK